MASWEYHAKRICSFILFKYPLLDALSLLMLFGERAEKESMPPIHPKLVYAYLIACIGCALLLSSGIKQKAACLVYAGQTLYLAVNFHNNPKWQYSEWQRLMLAVRQVGVLGVYAALAYLVDKKRSRHLLRVAEVGLGLFLFATVYLINSLPQYRDALSSHLLGGDYMRYLVAVTLAGAALAFFSGFFLRDMAICAAVTLLLVLTFVDSDLGYWGALGLHRWAVVRMMLNGGCATLGLFTLYLHVHNQLKDFMAD